MRSNVQTGVRVVDDRPRRQHLAAGRPRRDARGLVDLAAVVVAVAVERLAVVDPDARQRAPPEVLLEGHRPVQQRGRVGADDHHLVADRLDDARLVGQRELDLLDEPLDGAHRLLVAELLGQARVARQVGERDRHAQPAEIQPPVAQVGLHVADDVLLDEVLQEPAVGVVHDRRGQRQDLAREALHLLRHLPARDAVAHQRLVDVEVKEPDLGVGDLRHRLAVDAHELQEGDERQPGGEHGGRVAQQLHVVVGELLQPLGAEAHREEDALDQRGFEARLACGVGQRPGRGRVGQQTLDVAGGQAAALGRLADLGKRVAALAQPRDDARVGERRRGRRAVAVDGHEAGGDPAPQRRRGDADAPRDLGEARVLAAHRLGPLIKAARPRCRVPPLAGTARDEAAGARPRGAAPCGWNRATHSPALCLSWVLPWRAEVNVIGTPPDVR